MPRKNHKVSAVNYQYEKDREARFEDVYRRYFKRLYAYARAIVDSQSVAKDVVSDLFYGLWKNKTNLEDIENLEMYLFVSVRNLAIQTLKRSKVFESSDSLEVKIQSVDYLDPEELLLEKDLMEELEKLIASLPDQCQLIFTLSRERGMRNAEIADELGISVVTVKSQLRKAQAKLRAGVLKYYHDKGDSSLPDLRLIGECILLFEFIHSTLSSSPLHPITS